MRLPATALAALLLAVPVIAAAQIAAAQTAAPAHAAAGHVTEKDRQFLIKDAQGGAYEVAISTLAEQRSSRDDVKAYAARVVADHATYNQALRELAHAKGVNLPTTLTSEDQAHLTSLRSQTGSAADISFIKDVIRINSEDKRAAREEARRTSDPDIKAFLSKFAAMDAEHERMAKALRR